MSEKARRVIFHDRECPKILTKGEKACRCGAAPLEAMLDLADEREELTRRHARRARILSLVSFVLTLFSLALGLFSLAWSFRQLWWQK